MKVMLFVFVLATTGWEAFGSELPVETFFRNYQYKAVKLSPDGSCLATLAPIKQRVGLMVVDLDKRQANWAYTDRSADVDWFNWANTNRLVFRLSRDGYGVGGLMAVNRDGGRRRMLVPIGDHETGFLAVLPDAPDEILVESTAYAPDDSIFAFQNSHWVRRFPHVARMNLFTGVMTREVTNPGRVFQWWTDHKGAVRLGAAVDGTKIRIVHRANPGTNWETLSEYEFNEDGIEPVGFEPDNRTLLVSQIGGERTVALYTYDVEKRSVKDLAFRHTGVDLESVIFSTKKHTVAGASYQTERPQVIWFDSDRKKIQASVDLALPNTVNFLVSESLDEMKMIFFAMSDRNPGTFYLLKADTLKMEKLFDVAEWIDPGEMAEMKPIRYTSRDGLPIHGYLTLPKGSTGKNLPLIVNPHGGPAFRDVWGFDPEVQFFANRGYAVLRMNFRGSTGYGEDFLRAGYKQWGLKQQDDITDGVKWAIEQGIADPKRIYIYGGSYGGYAALMGLAQTPELYRCGISYAGVADIPRYMNWAIPDIRLARMSAAESIGDSKQEKERLRNASPLNHVDKIQAPVLLAYGKLDPKIPVWTGRDLAKALKKRGKLYAYIEKDDEGHGFFKEENKIEFWKKVDVFLKANLQ